jgi:hypothetical protein
MYVGVLGEDFEIVHLGDQEIAREERERDMAHLCTGVISLVCNF